MKTIPYTTISLFIPFIFGCNLSPSALVGAAQSVAGDPESSIPSNYPYGYRNREAHFYGKAVVPYRYPETPSLQPEPSASASPTGSFDHFNFKTDVISANPHGYEVIVSSLGDGVFPTFIDLIFGEETFDKEDCANSACWSKDLYDDHNFWNSSNTAHYFICAFDHAENTEAPYAPSQHWICNPHRNPDHYFSVDAPGRKKIVLKEVAFSNRRSKETLVVATKRVRYDFNNYFESEVVQKSEEEAKRIFPAFPAMYYRP